jgi:uncharacterized membrane protein YqgA involved in biofilm formation
MVSSMVAARLVARLGPRSLTTGGLVILAIGLVLLSRMRPDGSFVGDILVPSLIIATGATFVDRPTRDRRDCRYDGP